MAEVYRIVHPYNYSHVIEGEPIDKIHTQQ